MKQHFKELLNPNELWTRYIVLSQKPCPVPAESGVYAWYFKKIPTLIPIQNCHQQSACTLLYIGIAPSRPTSANNLRKRIRQHFRGNAYGSTLRLSLGCLLAEELRIELRRVGSGRRMTFGLGETLLSKWMEQNVFVTWTLLPEPWQLEEELIKQLSLPLNLYGNETHPFHSKLTMIRRLAKRKAEAMPVLA